MGFKQTRFYIFLILVKLKVNDCAIIFFSGIGSGPNPPETQVIQESRVDTGYGG